MEKETLNEFHSFDLEDVFWPLNSLLKKVNEDSEYSEEFKQKFNDTVKQLKNYHNKSR
jgi:hypothetical protein